jgi:hypothetical protein
MANNPLKSLFHFFLDRQEFLRPAGDRKPTTGMPLPTGITRSVVLKDKLDRTHGNPVGSPLDIGIKKPVNLSTG